MKSTLALLVPLFLVGCQDRERRNFDEHDEPAQLEPFRGDWQQDRLDFNHVDGEITELRIGGREFADNFANRGDIVVAYDQPEGSAAMLIEWRAFTMAASQDQAENQLAGLTPWYSDRSFDQPQPFDPLVDTACTPVWHEGCGIRAYYDGRSQPLRSGIDFRIHLPVDYVGGITIETEDNDAQEDYLNRGNVCIWDLPGRASVDVDRGLVFAKLADDLTVAPTCAAADVTTCEAMGWTAECPCIAGGNPFGALAIEGIASDILVEIAPATWTRFDLQTPSPSAGNAADECIAAIDVPGAVLDASDRMVRASGQVLEPAGATAGGGYAVRAESRECEPVRYTESPEMFIPGGEGTLDPKRGNITICQDCIQASSCDELLEGALGVR